jgi:hypothetical protein
VIYPSGSTIGQWSTEADQNKYDSLLSVIEILEVEAVSSGILLVPQRTSNGQKEVQESSAAAESTQATNTDLDTTPVSESRDTTVESHTL